MSSVYVWLKSEDEAQSKLVFCKKQEDSSYKGTFTAQSGTQSGKWVVAHVELNDAYGNQNDVYPVGSSTILANSYADLSGGNFTVGDGTVNPQPSPDDKTVVETPSGADLSYNGKVQTGVAETSQYTVKGGTATNPGTYTATLTLKDKANCVWGSTNKSDDIKVTWSIAEPDYTITADDTLILKYTTLTDVYEMKVTWSLSDSSVGSFGDESVTKTTQQMFGTTMTYQVATIDFIPSKVGFTEVYVAVDGKASDTYTIRVTPGCDHKWAESSRVEPTCTTEGGVEYTCSVCGRTKKEALAALGHEWAEWTVVDQPTTSTEGKKERVCSRCGQSQTETIAKLNPSSSPDSPNTEPSLTRCAGEEADQTSCAISQATFESSQWAILARMDDFADAMSATGLAGLLDAPILLTDRYGLSECTAAELSRLGVTNVYIIGGTGAMPGDFESQLRGCGITNVGRIFGQDYYDTSVECAKQIANYGGDAELSRAIIAYGQNFQDALSVSSFAYKYHVPIFLQTPGETSADRALPQEALNMLSTGEYAGASLYVTGGNGAVSYDSVERVFGDKLRGGVRIWGETGYDTSNQIASYMLTENLLSADTVCIATGAEAAKGLDALAGAALAGRNGGVMLLASAQSAMEPENYATITGGDSNGQASFFEVNASSVKNGYVLGGAYVLPDAFYAQVDSILAG